MNPIAPLFRRTALMACGVFTIVTSVAKAYISLDQQNLTGTGGVFVLNEDDGWVTDTAHLTLQLKLDGVDVPSTSVITRNGTTVTVTMTAELQPSKTYEYILTVPNSIGDPLVYDNFLNSFMLPRTLAGREGAVGSWGIREYPLSGANSIANALAAIASNPPSVEATSPVFNRYDPDTNNITSMGNFINDEPILCDAPGDQDLVVVGKTRITVPGPGDYTFAVHSDDGFAMRVSGPSGGAFISSTGQGSIDFNDDTTLFCDGGQSDSNTHGVYHFDAAGTYDILYLGYDGGGGAFYEVAWAPGAFTEDRQTSTWTLVGSPNDPSVPPYLDRFPKTLPGVAGTDGKWGIHTYMNATNIDSAEKACAFLGTTTRQPTDADGLTIDVQRPTLNANDPEAAAASASAYGDEPFPGNTSANDDHFVTIAKGRIRIATAGTYTLNYQGDDGFMLRIKGVDGAPNPPFKQVSGTGYLSASHPSECWGNGDARAVVVLAAGSYDLEFVQYENTGAFAYELTAAAGSWPVDNPPTGWQLVGAVPPAASIAVPKIASPGWSVESSVPGIKTINNLIADAEASLSMTAALSPLPDGALSTWTNLNFWDPELGTITNYSPSTPFPTNTPNADINYALRATGQLVVTVGGEYHLGYQGDDGGYMVINGPGNPAFKKIVFTNHPTIAKLREEVVGVTGYTNMVTTETASPNSRTIVSVDLLPGTYTIRTLMFQSTGNSFWQVFGSQTPGSTSFVYPLLASDGASTVTVPAGLTLAAQTVTPVSTPFTITGFTTTGSPVTGAHFSFGSGATGTYSVQISTDMVNWTTVPATITDGGSGTSSANADFTGQLIGGQPVSGQPKLFVRVVRTF